MSKKSPGFPYLSDAEANCPIAGRSAIDVAEVIGGTAGVARWSR